MPKVAVGQFRQRFLGPPRNFAFPVIAHNFTLHLFSSTYFAISWPRMPPKAKKSDSQKEDEQREALQAVLLTDSYENRFAPYTLEKPRVCTMKFLILDLDC
jgi:hypothetical protein